MEAFEWAELRCEVILAVGIGPSMLVSDSSTSGGRCSRRYESTLARKRNWYGVRRRRRGVVVGHPEEGGNWGWEEQGLRDSGRSGNGRF